MLCRVCGVCVHLTVMCVFADLYMCFLSCRSSVICPEIPLHSALQAQLGMTVSQTTNEWWSHKKNHKSSCIDWSIYITKSWFLQALFTANHQRLNWYDLTPTLISVFLQAPSFLLTIMLGYTYCLSYCMLFFLLSYFFPFSSQVFHWQATIMGPVSIH